MKNKKLTLFGIGSIILAIILFVTSFVQYPFYTDQNTILYKGICTSVKTEYSPSFNRSNSDRVTIIELQDGTRFFLGTTQLIELNLTVNEMEAQCVGKQLSICANKTLNTTFNAYDIAEIVINEEYLMEMSFSNSLHSQSRIICMVFSFILIGCAVGLFVLDRSTNRQKTKQRNKNK